MNKETFLAQLREYIQVLEEQEQEDILEEYAQHIDIKIQKGLSEEEAIADFGSMKVLAAEILEAYHVKPEYGRKKKPYLLPVKTVEGKKPPFNALMRFCAWCREKGTAACRFIKSVLRRTGIKCRTFAGWLARPFGRRRPDSERIYETGEETMGRMERNREVRGSRNLFHLAGRGCTKVWRLSVLCALFCFRLFWNMVWLLFSLIFAGFAMTALAGAGMLIILYFQNYPFGGFLLISLGAVMCFGTLAWWAFSLLIRKKTTESERSVQKEDPDRSGEVFAG